MSGAGRPAATPDDDEVPEPELARERTELAWTRSAIAFFALGIAVLRIRPAVGIPVIAIAVVIWLIAKLPRAGHPAWMASRRELVVTVAVTTLALVALVLTLAAPSSHGMRL